MVIYIHGFGGSGEGFKAKEFRNYYKSISRVFLAPSLSYVPNLAIKTLEEIVRACKSREIRLIGSSLGGYYASFLSQKFNLKTVLINPSIYPYQTLSRVTGKGFNFYDESSFEWRESHLWMLKNYDVEKPKSENFMLLLQKGDELLNYKEALEKFSNSKIILEEGGSHSFEGIDRYFETINEFLL